MPLTVTVPNFRTKGISTRDAIISVLSYRWPLTANEIFERIKKEHGLEVSYQATHKKLLQLQEENILKKQGKEFELSKDWIEETGDFFQNLKKNHRTSKNNYRINPKFEGTITLKFDDYSEFAVAMGNIFAKKLIVGNRSEPGIGITKHAWFSLKFNFTDFSLISKMSANNGGAYVIIQNDTPLDRWIAKQYLAAGFSGVKLGAKEVDMENDMVIHGDSIVEVKFSEETKKDIERIYSCSDSLSELFRLYASNSLKRNTHNIEVKITKKPDLAKALQELLMEKYFGVGENGC